MSTAAAVRNMVRAERAALARQQEFTQASMLAVEEDVVTGPPSPTPVWSEHTQQLILGLQKDGAADAIDEEEIISEMMQLPAEAARARLSRELSAAMHLPVTVAAYEDEQEPPAVATVAPAASAVSDAAWAALTKRVSDLEASNAELRTTISQLSEMVSTLRGGGGYGSYAPSPEKQVVGAAARHLAASRAAQLAPAATVVAPERDDAPTSTHNGKPAAGEPLPAAGVDLRAAIARKAHQTPNYALPAVTGEADASTPMMSCPRAAPFSAIDSPTAPPQPTSQTPCAAAHQLVAAVAAYDQQRERHGERSASSNGLHGTRPLRLGGASVSSPNESQLAASLSAARSAAEDRVAKVERAERAAERAADFQVERGEGGRASPVSIAVGTWWASHFGTSGAAGDVVPFERMRAAAEAELGPLSSVDIQLLRLELSDERGKLTKAALRRLLSSSADAPAGGRHATVGDALRALLQAARAQLDRQVEVRMRQAASRTASKASAAAVRSAGSPGRSVARSPVERRVRLEFDG